LSLTLRSLVDSGAQKQAAAGRDDSVIVYRGTVLESFACTPNCDHRSGSGSGATPRPDASDAGAAAKPAPK
jgi:hypothetical protein